MLIQTAPLPLVEAVAGSLPLLGGFSVAVLGPLASARAIAVGPIPRISPVRARRKTARVRRVLSPGKRHGRDAGEATSLPEPSLPLSHTGPSPERPEPAFPDESGTAEEPTPAAGARAATAPTPVREPVILPAPPVSNSWAAPAPPITPSTPEAGSPIPERGLPGDSAVAPAPSVSASVPGRGAEWYLQGGETRATESSPAVLRRGRIWEGPASAPTTGEARPVPASPSVPDRSTEAVATPSGAQETVSRAGTPPVPEVARRSPTHRHPEAPAPEAQTRTAPAEAADTEVRSDIQGVLDLLRRGAAPAATTPAATIAPRHSAAPAPGPAPAEPSIRAEGPQAVRRHPDVPGPISPSAPGPSLQPDAGHVGMEDLFRDRSEGGVDRSPLGWINRMRGDAAEPKPPMAPARPEAATTAPPADPSAERPSASPYLGPALRRRQLSPAALASRPTGIPSAPTAGPPGSFRPARQTRRAGTSTTETGVSWGHSPIASPGPADEEDASPAPNSTAFAQAVSPQPPRAVTVVRRRAEPLTDDAGQAAPPSVDPASGGSAAAPEAPHAADPFASDLQFVLRAEGGLVDDPKDRGGRTQRGITQGTLDSWRKRHGLPVTKEAQVPAQRLRDLRRNDATEIFSWKIGQHKQEGTHASAAARAALGINQAVVAQYDAAKAVAEPAEPGTEQTPAGPHDGRHRQPKRSRAVTNRELLEIAAWHAGQPAPEAHGSQHPRSWRASDPARLGLTQDDVNAYRAERSQVVFRTAQVPAQDVQGLTPRETARVYREEYYERGKGAGKKHTPAPATVSDPALRLILFDSQVLLSGRFFARISPILKESTDPKDKARRILDERAKYHREVVKKNPQQKKFLQGWLNRVEALRAWVNTPPPTGSPVPLGENAREVDREQASAGAGPDPAPAAPISLGETSFVPLAAQRKPLDPPSSRRLEAPVPPIPHLPSRRAPAASGSAGDESERPAARRWVAGEARPVSRPVVRRKTSAGTIARQVAGTAPTPAGPTGLIAQRPPADGESSARAMDAVADPPTPFGHAAPPVHRVSGARPVESVARPSPARFVPAGNRLRGEREFAPLRGPGTTSPTPLTGPAPSPASGNWNGIPAPWEPLPAWLYQGGVWNASTAAPPPEAVVRRSPDPNVGQEHPATVPAEAGPTTASDRSPGGAAVVGNMPSALDAIGDADVDRLAKAVYASLKARLALERRRIG